MPMIHLALISCAKAQLGQPCSKGGLNGWELLWIMLVVLTLGSGIWQWTKKKLNIPDKPAAREPMTDFPPIVGDLITGSMRPAYTASVRAVTPGGIAVRQTRCCKYGHKTPAQAVAHASTIAARISRTGR
jgi:hypothetical protein